MSETLLLAYSAEASLMKLILSLLVVGTLTGCMADVRPAPQWIAPRAADASLMSESAKWIWAADPDGPAPDTSNAPPGPVVLSRTFLAPDQTRECLARLALAADNRAVAFLNGREVLRSESWSQPTFADVPLRPGKNALVIMAENSKGPDTNPAGVIALLEAQIGGGSKLVVATDEKWMGQSGPLNRHTVFGADPHGPTQGGAPAPVVVLGPASTEPWKLDPTALVRATSCPMLRTEFRVEGRPTQATVRVIGLGHYELRLNGHVVGDTLLNQAWSQYDKTLFWQEFDISPWIQSGANAWGVVLGNSFWHVAPPNDPGRFAKTDAMPDFSNGQPYLLWLEARVRIADGRETVVTSDAGWKWTDGPLTFSHIYAGEDYDATRELPGWDRPGFDDGDWRPIVVCDAPPARLEPFSCPGLKAFETFKPVEIREPAPGVFTYVFPQNCSALLRFTVEGPRGHTIRFKPCEYMDESGRVRFTYTWGTGKDIWHDYTLRGGGTESHQTIFCYVGCQYVEVTGAVPDGRPNPDGLPVIKNLDLVHVRTANRIAGEFTCSSPLQNAAHRLIDWSIRSNMSYVSTDCPHREKNGWQEQNWHMARAMAYRFDIHDWYAKIARDLRDTQLPDGHIPTNCPNYLVGIPPHGFWNEAPEWGIAGVLVPWHLYEWYDDREALTDAFESMKRYVDYLSSTARDGVITSNLGDWYDYGHGKGDGPSQWTPAEVSATAIWALGVSTVARAAEVLNRGEDAERYHALFGRIRDTFQQRFWDAEAKTVRNNGSCQAGNAAALCIGLIPEADRPAALRKIVDDLAARGWQQTTGEVLQVFLVRALSEGGRADALHRVYAREDRGSYGYMVNQGLTTLPESWDARPGTGNSMNHFMLGHLMEWHYAYVAGIRQQPGRIGWKRILIAPDPGPLDHAEASFNSPAGRIVSRWQRQGEAFELLTEVPTGVEAIALLPDGSRHALRAGSTTLTCTVPRRE